MREPELGTAAGSNDLVRKSGNSSGCESPPKGATRHGPILRRPLSWCATIGALPVPGRRMLIMGEFAPLIEKLSDDRLDGLVAEDMGVHHNLRDVVDLLRLV